MNTSIKALSFLCAVGLAACSGESTPDGSQGGGNTGKADDVEEVECAPSEELSLELVGRDANESSDGDALTNSVTATCFNNSGFEDAVCCAEAGLFEAYEDATSCPERVVVEGSGAQQRCRNASDGEFVSSACCSDICDPEATRNSADQCVDSNGQFEDSLCCFLASALEEAACDGTAWETLTVGGEERTACRNQDTGRFALNACCAAECVAAVSAGELSGTAIPEACAAAVDLVAPELECPSDSIENSAGICHNPENGQFVKAACCQALGPVAVACGFDTEPSFGVFDGAETEDGETLDPSHQLRDALGVSPLFVELGDPIDAGVRAQLEATILHAGFLLPGQERVDAELFGATDDSGFDIFSGEVNGVRVDWVRYFAGDTEVGVVFDAGTAQIIAEIGDGDISGCDPAA